MWNSGWKIRDIAVEVGQSPRGVTKRLIKFRAQHLGWFPKRVAVAA
jgi:hypothetical protein